MHQASVQGNLISLCELTLDELTAQPNPASVLPDAVQNCGDTEGLQGRITALHLTYMSQDRHHDLVLMARGVAPFWLAM